MLPWRSYQCWVPEWRESQEDAAEVKGASMRMAAERLVEWRHEQEWLDTSDTLIEVHVLTLEGEHLRVDVLVEWVPRFQALDGKPVAKARAE